MWHGYVERHTISDGGRKRAGSDARRSQPSDVALVTPDGVASWVSASLATLAKDADGDAALKNALLIHPENVIRSTARKGSSVYASVHATRDEVWDVCAEVMTDPAESCPARPGGHEYKENDKGEWRCAHCGKPM